MQQNKADQECDRESRTGQQEKGRMLTYDETKAAEAAFRGDPFNPLWSAAAAQVYAGISEAMAKREPTSSRTPAEREEEYISC